MSYVTLASLELHALAALRAQPVTTSRTIPFPRKTLAQFLSNEGTAVPGAHIDSPPFAAGGSKWQVLLYLFGAGESYAGRVGVYIKRLAAERIEVDASFELSLQVLPDAATLGEDPTTSEDSCRRGLEFKCGMTFCDAKEAGESVGRCEDWGAHVFSTGVLLKELENDESCVLAVHVRLSVWDERPCPSGSSFAALREQTQRVPAGSLRCGEVVVALAGGAGSGGPAEGGTAAAAGTYRCVPGVEYRIMRIVRADGEGAFTYDASRGEAAGTTVYLLPTSKAARGEGSAIATRRAADAAVGSVAIESVLLDDDATGSSLPGARLVRGGLQASRAALRSLRGDDAPPTQQSDRATDTASASASASATASSAPGAGGVQRGAEGEAEAEATWGVGTRWPVGVPVSALPPLGSRLGFRALPARLGYAARTSGSVLLVLIAIGASPLWGAYAWHAHMHAMCAWHACHMHAMYPSPLWGACAWHACHVCMACIHGMHTWHAYMQAGVHA